ncbi:MAG: 50S ribosomal protein L21 [Gammaproteobacteria bacterium]
MYAVIVTGGKQYKVAQGDTLKIEKLDVEPEQNIDFDQVLMVVDGENVKIGAPHLSGAKVTASVVEHGRGEKIRIVKVRRRKNSRRQMGHRQHYTKVKILNIAA